MSWRGMGRSMALPPRLRSAISRRKLATRSCAVLARSSMRCCTRRSSPVVRAKIAGNLRIAAGEGRERAALDHAQPRVGNRFRREGARTGKLKSDNISRQIKTADLPAAVAEYLVGSHTAIDHVVEVVRGLALAEDFAIARIRCDRPHDVDGGGKRRCLAGTAKDVGWRRRSAIDRWGRAANVGLRKHDPSHCALRR